MLICTVIALGAASLLAAGFATHALPFLIAALFIGLGSVAVQIIIPFYQAGLFGAFTLFWTVVPLQLASQFGFSQRGIALFALAGAAGSALGTWAFAQRGWPLASAIGLALPTASLLYAATE